jgi:coenzyme Q-binding protein COQ10
MPYVEVQQEVPLPPDVVYGQLSDMTSFPRFMESVEAITILERGENRTVSRWETRLQGTRFVWTEEDTFLPAERRILYRQLSGDLRKFEGEWRVLPQGEGSLVTLTVDFDFGIPMLAALLNPVAQLMIRKNAASMLAGLARELGA